MNLDIVKQQLVEDGFRPTDAPEAGGLLFKFEGGTYYVDTDVRDEMYVRIGYPGIWTPSTPAQLGAAWEAAAQVTESMKAVKAYVSRGSVHCTVEQFLTKPEDFRVVLPRALLALQSGSKKFVELLAEKKAIGG